ncbi:hypothetical protein FNF27_06937 [Cafeteria roenbergensis]|uniref:Uncharacterized protein n=2 Tax=Cafeteria roenbergensis TaxID=33653 RepID=A0A5A8DHJ5_CAFRO|nr:hypothetical protein FNF28_05047 [Cafeteria roenbergensis]KAA0164846.1 hypothetical protein FNF31_02169 [Cafeteria roenbergensis]KAA0169512.1 hypothetical protein FNF27_06937 [Cafeteria roenbergensis]
MLSLAYVSPQDARTRLELGQAFFTFITRLRAAKGLCSADNEDIVELLGRLGTASMELAHCADMDAVLQHAGVALTMPGGRAQLAKWHRLGHLQSVAGGFAEVMAKPSTIATVQEHAKELLLEAEEQAEEQAEKAKREAEEQELRLAPARKLMSLLDSCLLVIDGRQGKALLDVLILRVQAALVSRLPPDSPVMAGLPPDVVRLSRRLEQRTVDNACKLAEAAGAAVPHEDLSRAGLQTVADRLIAKLTSWHDLCWLASQPALFDILHCTATACPPVFLSEGGKTANVAKHLRPDVYFRRRTDWHGSSVSHAFDCSWPSQAGNSFWFTGPRGAGKTQTLLSMGFANAFLGAAHGQERSTVILLRPCAGQKQIDGGHGDKQSTLESRIIEGAARDPKNMVWRAMLRLGYLDAHLGGKSGLEVAAESMRTMEWHHLTEIDLRSIGTFGDMLDGHDRTPEISMTLCFDESQDYYLHRGVLSRFVNFVRRYYTSNIPMRFVITGSSALLPRLIGRSGFNEEVLQQDNAHSAAVRESGVSAPEFADAAAPGSSFSSYGYGFNMSKMQTLDPVPYLEESEGLSFLQTSWRQHSADLRRFMETLPESTEEAQKFIAPLVTATNGSPQALLQIKWGAVVQGGIENAMEAALNHQFRRFRELWIAAKIVPERLVLLKAVGLVTLGQLKPEVANASTGLETAGGKRVNQFCSIVRTSSDFVSPRSLLSAALSASRRLFGDDAAHTKELEGFVSRFSDRYSQEVASPGIEAAADFWHEVGFFRGRTLTDLLVMPGQVWRSFAVQLVLAGSSLTTVEMMALDSPSSPILSDHFERLLAAELLQSGFQAFVSASMARFAPGRECSSRLMERLAATASTDGAAAALVSHRHVAKDDETLPSPPALEPIAVGRGTSTDLKGVAADKDDEPIKPWQLLKHRRDRGGMDVMVVFAVKHCVYVLLLQSTAREPSIPGAPKEMAAATAAKLQTGMFEMATELQSAVVPSPERRKAWSDIPAKRSLIARIMDNDIARGCTEMVLCSSVITTKLIKEARPGCDTDLVRIPESPETFILEDGVPCAAGSAAKEPRSIQVWDLRLPADSLVLRKLMTKDMEDALRVCGIELPGSGE